MRPIFPLLLFTCSCRCTGGACSSMADIFMDLQNSQTFKKIYHSITFAYI